MNALIPQDDSVSSIGPDRQLPKSNSGIAITSGEGDAQSPLVQKNRLKLMRRDTKLSSHNLGPVKAQLLIKLSDMDQKQKVIDEEVSRK